MESLYTINGLTRLATIVRQARGDRSYRDFELLTGVSHSVVRRLEVGDAKNPDDITILRIARYTPYSFEELKAIAQERNVLEPSIQFKTAEDVMPIVEQLPISEMVRLAKLMIDMIARI